MLFSGLVPLLQSLMGNPAIVGNGLNTVSESMVSNTEQFLVSLLALTEFRGESSVSSSQPFICVPKRTHPIFRRTHRVSRKTQSGSVSSLLRNSTLETVFRPFPKLGPGVVGHELD